MERKASLMALLVVLPLIELQGLELHPCKFTDNFVEIITYDEE